MIQVQRKKEEDVMYFTTEKINDSSLIDVSVQEDRLEDVDHSDNDDSYEDLNQDYEHLDEEVVRSPSPKSRKTKTKEQTSQKYQCHQCGLTFTSQDLLKMHMHEIHETQLHTRYLNDTLILKFCRLYIYITDLCAGIVDTTSSTQSRLLST